MSSGYYCNTLVGATGINATFAYVANVFQVPFTGSTNTTLTNIRQGGTALQFVSYSVGTKLPNCGYRQSGTDISDTLQPVAGEKLFTIVTANTNVSTTFTVPSNVYALSIVCVGGGGGGTATVVGFANYPGVAGGNSFVSTNPGNVIVCQGGGGGAGTFTTSGGVGGTPSGVAGATGFAGGAGGGGYNDGTYGYPGGGGGAGGYTAVGGTGGNALVNSGVGGTGTSSGGGGGASFNNIVSGVGGGVGVYPSTLNNGAGGSFNTGTSAQNGGGGSGGSSNAVYGGWGGLYGGGGFSAISSNFPSAFNGGAGGGALAYINNYTVTPGQVLNVQVGCGGVYGAGSGSAVYGGDGVVRILWGYGRVFPNTGLSTAFNPS